MEREDDERANKRRRISSNNNNVEDDIPLDFTDENLELIQNTLVGMQQSVTTAPNDLIPFAKIELYWPVLRELRLQHQYDMRPLYTTLKDGTWFHSGYEKIANIMQRARQVITEHHKQSIHGTSSSGHLMDQLGKLELQLRTAVKEAEIEDSQRKALNQLKINTSRAKSYSVTNTKPNDKHKTPSFRAKKRPVKRSSSHPVESLNNNNSDSSGVLQQVSQVVEQRLLLNQASQRFLQSLRDRTELTSRVSQLTAPIQNQQQPLPSAPNVSALDFVSENTMISQAINPTSTQGPNTPTTTTTVSTPQMGWSPLLPLPAATQLQMEQDIAEHVTEETAQDDF